MIDELLQRLSGTPAGKMAGEAMGGVDWDGVHQRAQASFDRVRNAGSSLALESGMVPPPPDAPYQPGDFQRSGPQMRPVGVGETMRDTFLPQRDEQGIPKPMGAADILNAALWIAPGFKGLKTAAPTTAPATGGGIRAYHGSPHDFERFDMSKIGTGEGAQAYGHGLYFAENEGVAQSYRDALTARGTPLTPKPEQVARQAFEFARGDTKTALDKLRDSVSLLAEDESLPRGYVPKYSIDDYRNAVALVEEGWQPPKGKMYEVNINAKPEQMLDWDRPIAAQPAPVQDIARKMPRLRGAENELTGGHFHEALSGDILNEIAHTPYDKRKWPMGGNTDPYVAETLRDAGIPGIKYLDQGSRFAGTQSVPHLKNQISQLEEMLRSPPKGKAADIERALTQRRAELTDAQKTTSNYVMFDDKLIDILRKYGLAGVLPAGAATMSNNDAKAAQ